MRRPLLVFAFVALGAAGVLAFIGKPRESATGDRFARPSVTAVGGLGTEKGTWGVVR